MDYRDRTMAETKHGGYVWLPRDFELDGDYDNPRTYAAERCTNTGRLLGRRCRVRVDHDATGTHTGGTGDTVVRVV